VPRVKSAVIILWIAFGLIALMHGPFELLGDFAEGFSCMTGVAVIGHSDESTESDSPFEGLACRRARHMGNLPKTANTMSGLAHAQHGDAMAESKQKSPDSQLSFLLANWQFLRRAALAPRAP
jgi:hypothetical protein